MFKVNNKDTRARSMKTFCCLYCYLSSYLVFLMLYLNSITFSGQIIQLMIELYSFFGCLLDLAVKFEMELLQKSVFKGSTSPKMFLVIFSDMFSLFLFVVRNFLHCKFSVIAYKYQLFCPRKVLNIYFSIFHLFQSFISFDKLGCTIFRYGTSQSF